MNGQKFAKNEICVKFSRVASQNVDTSECENH